MTCWILDNIIGIVGILVSAFTAYHLYFLTVKVDLKDKLSHKEYIVNKTEVILEKIRSGFNSKIELVNIKKYEKYYPHSNDFNSDGYTYLGAELKSIRYDGIEFICGIKELYRNSNGILSLKNKGDAVREPNNAIMVGVVPYSWIQYVEVSGDEFGYRPQFFIDFNGTKKEPFMYYKYYIKNNEQDINDPIDLKYILIHVES